MKKNGHRLLTLAALVGTAAGVIHIANRFIDATSQLKDMLEQPHSKTYDCVLERFFIQNRDMAPLFFLFMISCQVLPVMNGMP